MNEQAGRMSRSNDEIIKTVHEGRGGYVELEGVRYTIDHIAEGCFFIPSFSGWKPYAQPARAY